MWRALIGQHDPAIGFGFGGALKQERDRALGPLKALGLIGHDIRQVIQLAGQMGDALFIGGYIGHEGAHAPNWRACQNPFQR